MLWSAVLPVSPLKPLCIPSLLTGKTVQEAEKAWSMCNHHSEVMKTFLCNQHCFQDKCKTLPHATTTKKINTISSKTRQHAGQEHPVRLGDKYYFPGLVLFHPCDMYQESIASSLGLVFERSSESGPKYI